MSDSGAGEGIRTPDPDLGKREITVSPRSIAVRENPPKCAAFRDFGQGGIISRLRTPVDSRELRRTTVEARDGNREVTAAGKGVAVEI